MSLIKDAIDLIDNLNEKITDRAILEAFGPVREKFIAIQREQLDLDRKHWEEVTKAHAINVELREKNSELAEEARGWKAKYLELQNKYKSDECLHLVFRDSHYYLQSELDEGNAFPFCTACYDGHKKCIRLAKTPTPSGFTNMAGMWTCPACNAQFQ